MTLYATFSIIIVLAALFAYLNHRFIKLPPSIGLMLIALLTSLTLVVIGTVYPVLLKDASNILKNFDFSELLLGSMLSFMLFAGAIHIKLDELKKEKLPVILFSTLSVILSTFIIGTGIYYLLSLFNLQTSYIYCLLFGSLISPTDPIAVLSILKSVKIPKSLEMKLAGESLFNDGVAVVVFLTLLQVAQKTLSFRWLDIAGIFVREAFGGLMLGIVIGYLGFLLMRSIDNYRVEVLLTLAMVMGGYSLASILQISGPLAMVAAGILTGNGKKYSMSDTTTEYVDKFWELVDDILNTILFVLIGFELLLIPFISSYLLLGIITIVMVILTRFISIWLPAHIIRLKEKINNRTIFILTWGGLRGGISIALALSLKPEFSKDLFLALTYFVVAFSILFQGLTIGRLARKIKSG
jgi:CPA1 family monovalent cation:H+ antiporter